MRLIAYDRHLRHARGANPASLNSLVSKESVAAWALNRRPVAGSISRSGQRCPAGHRARRRSRGVVARQDRVPRRPLAAALARQALGSVPKTSAPTSVSASTPLAARPTQLRRANWRHCARNATRPCWSPKASTSRLPSPGSRPGPGIRSRYWPTTSPTPHRDGVGTGRGAERS